MDNQIGNCDGFVNPAKLNGGIPLGKLRGLCGPCEGCKCEAKIPTTEEVKKSILAACEHTTKLVDEVKKKGFTLIELLIVFAIICIIGFMALSALKQKGIL